MASLLSDLILIMLRRFLRSTLRAGCDIYSLYAFRNSDQAVRYRGVYPTLGAATAALPAGRLEGFDSGDLTDYFLEVHFSLDASDYPILLWLSQILPSGHRVFDLGGGLGQCCYVYQKYIPFPADVRWLVCDVQAFDRRGREIASERKADFLCFTDNWQEADGFPIYLTNGTLQYLEPDLAEILRELRSKPQHVLVNRVPMYDGEPYYTVQRGRHLCNCPAHYFPYKVMNTGRFIRGMEEIGYEKVDQWNLPRALHVPLHPQQYVSNYKGFYFVLSESNT
jgi:putative methyltransferase (TIGR04325 family)